MSPHTAGVAPLNQTQEVCHWWNPGLVDVVSPPLAGFLSSPLLQFHSPNCSDNMQNYLFRCLWLHKTKLLHSICILLLIQIISPQILEHFHENCETLVRLTLRRASGWKQTRQTEEWRLGGQICGVSICEYNPKKICTENARRTEGWGAIYVISHKWYHVLVVCLNY